MARFEFSLERALRWRSVELAVEQTKLKQLTQEQFRIQTAAVAVTGEISKLAQSLVTMPSLTGEDLRASTSCRLRLKRQLENLAAKRLQNQRELVAQTRKYNQAKQRVRLLERLRAKRLDAWAQAQNFEQEQLAAESYLAAWNRERQ